MKQILHDQQKGGYKLEVYAPEIQQAIINSEEADKSPKTDYPDVSITKVYRLAKMFVDLMEKKNGRVSIA